MESWASKNSLVDWELRASPSFVTDSILTSSSPVKTGQSLVDLGLRDAPMKQILGDFMLDHPCGRIARGRDANRSASPRVAAANGSLSGEEDPSLKLSGCRVDPSPRIDLKLGRSAGQRDSHGSGLSRGAQVLSSLGSSTPMKRCRFAGFSNQVAYCQVHGCNKDLSSSKDYHKRHKVCELHSKTPKVIVGGIEQRFCQQCSRFHLLCEFDDGKRSCRRRLAGHNQRRRKPQVGFRSSGRFARFLLPYNASKFHGVNDLISHIKLEASTNYSPLTLSSSQHGDLHSRLPLSSPSNNNALCSFQESNRDSSTRFCMFSNIIQYSGPSQLVNGDPSAGNEELGSIFNTESPNKGLSTMLEPGCARSLLSSSSQKSPSHTSGTPLGQTLSQYSVVQLLDNPVVDVGSNRFLGSSEGGQAVPAVVSEISNEILHGSGFSNMKDCLSSEEAPTIDLLQLSSRLKRVEHERQYTKLEFNKVAQ